jgi:hypothetical protein
LAAFLPPGVRWNPAPFQRRRQITKMAADNSDNADNINVMLTTIIWFVILGALAVFLIRIGSYRGHRRGTQGPSEQAVVAAKHDGNA